MSALRPSRGDRSAGDSLVWLRRDLRIHDHPALRAAVEAGAGVVPVFCFDDGLLKGRHASGARTQFLLESLAELDRALQARGVGRRSASCPRWPARLARGQCTSALT
jgi:hypothetical protein